jgi:hypothetical protein
MNTWRIPSSGIWRYVTLVRTDVSEELSTSIIRVTRIGELGTTFAVTSDRHTLRRNTKYLYFFVGGTKFLRNVGTYKGHTAAHSRRRHSSKALCVCVTRLSRQCVIFSILQKHRTARPGTGIVQLSLFTYWITHLLAHLNHSNTPGYTIT